MGFTVLQRGDFQSIETGGPIVEGARILEALKPYLRSTVVEDSLILVSTFVVGDELGFAELHKSL